MRRTGSGVAATAPCTASTRAAAAILILNSILSPPKKRLRPLDARRESLVHALPFVVADNLLVLLEIHSAVAQRELARLHVDQHRLDRLGGVHHGVETQHRAIEAELAQLFHAEDRRMAAHQRIADLRDVESFADALELV